MPIAASARIDLIDSDPNVVSNIQGGPEPQDEWLHFRFSQDYPQYQRMRRDPHVRSRLDKRVDAILGRSVLVEAPKKRGAAKAAEKVQSILDKVKYEALCKAVLKSGMLIGFSVLQIDFVEDEDDKTLLIPKWKFVPQSRFTFAYHKPDDRAVLVVNDDDLDPATEILLVHGYELRLLTKRAPIYGERVPKNRFLCFTFDSEDSPWGLGLGYSIFPWWEVKRCALKAWLLHSDRQGSPPTIGTTPADLDPSHNDDHKKIIADFEGFLKALSPSNWASFPEGFTAQLLETIGQSGPEVHQALIREADNQISKVVLGEVPFSDKDTGSYAANASQVEDRSSTLTDGDCNLLDEQLYDGLWLPTFELNSIVDDAPIVRRESFADTRKAALEKQKLEHSKAVADRDKELQELGYRRTAQSVLEIHGEGLESIQTDTEKPPLVSTIGVGGTQALLGLLQQASSGELPKENAVAAMVAMFGLDEKTAGAIVPEPKQENSQSSSLDQLFGGDTAPTDTTNSDTPAPQPQFTEPESEQVETVRDELPSEFAAAVAALSRLDTIGLEEFGLVWDDTTEFDEAIAALNRIEVDGIEVDISLDFEEWGICQPDRSYS
jgi:hypothetical protein